MPQDLQTDIYHLSHASPTSINWMDRYCHSSSQKIEKNPELLLCWMDVDSGLFKYIVILYIFSFRNKMVWDATSLCLKNILQADYKECFHLFTLNKINHKFKSNSFHFQNCAKRRANLIFK